MEVKSCTRSNRQSRIFFNNQTVFYLIRAMRIKNCVILKDYTCYGNNRLSASCKYNFLPCTSLCNENKFVRCLNWIVTVF